MCANFHADRSNGLACASEIYIHTHTNIQAKIAIKLPFFCSSWGYGGSMGGSLWVAAIGLVSSYDISK